MSIESPKKPALGKANQAIAWILNVRCEDALIETFFHDIQRDQLFRHEEHGLPPRERSRDDVCDRLAFTGCPEDLG